MKAVLIKVALILGFIWSLPAQSQAADEQALRSAGQFLRNSQNFDSFYASALAAWQRNCDGERPQACVVEECDVLPDSCRPGHLLLFRGEAKRNNHPAVSHFLRTRWAGSSYASGTVSDWLKQLIKDVGLLRPMTMGPDQGDSLILVREQLNSRWFYKGTDILYKSSTDFAGQSLSLLNMLFILHTQAAYPFFKDPVIGEKSLDPLVSFSLSPQEAFKFSKNKGGVFLVASVPRNEFYFSCEENLPEPGQFFDPSFCLEKSLFPEEMEFDAFLFVAPKYVFKSFLRD